MGEAVIIYAAAARRAANSADALASANTAETTLHNANSMAAYYQRQVDSPDTPPANLAGYTRESWSTWEGRADDATRTISSAVATLQSAISSRDSAANTAISSIENIGDSGDLNDSAWDNIVQWVHENKGRSISSSTSSATSPPR